MTRKTREDMDSFAWNKEGKLPPWYGQGDAFEGKPTAKQILKKAGLDWEVEKRPLFVKRDGGYEPVPNKFELARKSDDTTLSIVGSSYKPVQNIEPIEFITKIAEESGAGVEAAGSMWHGRYIWALARIDADFTVGNKKADDRMQNYLMMCSPHVLGKALSWQFASMRFTCWNMLTFGLGASLNRAKKGDRISMPHSMDFNDEVRENIAGAIQIATAQATELKEAANLLAKKKAEADKVEEYFCELLKFDPTTSEKVRKQDGEVRVPLLLPKFREALIEAPVQDIATAKGTWWGALNAVTAVIDHNHGRDRSAALKNSWMGGSARMKRRALELALAKAA